MSDGEDIRINEQAQQAEGLTLSDVDQRILALMRRVQVVPSGLFHAESPNNLMLEIFERAQIPPLGFPEAAAGIGGVASKSLTYEEDPNFDPANPTIIFNGGNFCGKNIDTVIVPITDDHPRYMFGRVKFNYSGKIEVDTIEVAHGTQDPDDPERQNSFPEYEDGDNFTGEAWYYMGRFVRTGASPDFDVVFNNAHPGGNVLFEYGCEGNIRWGVQP